MRNRGFTLLEVVLAIGLAGVVITLLATSLDLYLARVDASRTQVESAQLARTLLNQIANDLRAARYFAPPVTATADSSDDASNTETESDSLDPSTVQGIFGSEFEIRIDRSAPWQWAQLTRQADSFDETANTLSSTSQNAMPQTVQYHMGEGKELLANRLAAEGISEQALATGYAGLFRSQRSTVARLAENSGGTAVSSGDDSENAELLAPEVVDISFGYFDGQQLLTAWDSSEQEGLPTAVEICITLLQEPFEQAVTRSPNARDELRRSKENLVEYRLFVKLPDLRAAQESAFPTATNDSSSEDSSGPQGQGF